MTGEAMMTSEEVARAVGTPYRTLMRWVEQRLIHVPDYVGRQGNTVRWPAKCVREAMTIAELRREGCSMQCIREVAGYLQTLKFNPFSRGWHLVLEKNTKGKARRVVRVCDNGDVLELMKQHRGQLLLFDLDPARAGEAAA